MADPRHPTLHAAAGFTLAEMLAALLILLIGMTALIGALGSSIGQRRTTEARISAAAVCEEAMQRVREEAMRRRAGAATDLELEIQPLADQAVSGFPGMTWSATAEVDPNRPDVWLVRLVVRWLDEGEEASQEFLRVMPRCLPMAARVRRFEDERRDTTAR